jgi:hypothetical protein
MKEEQERELYWKAVQALREIISSGNRSAEDILEELEDDLGE